jgi:hypothetical protein
MKYDWFETDLKKYDFSKDIQIELRDWVATNMGSSCELHTDAFPMIARLAVHKRAKREGVTCHQSGQ